MSAAQPPALSGVFVPNLVPLDARGEINEGELRRYVDWLIDHGVHGLYPNGSTGEFVRFTAEERRHIVAIMADQTAGRVPILAGAAEANARETISACEYYHSLGVRAVAIVAPFYYRLSPGNVFAYFKEIADHSPIDVTLYNIPMFASPIDLPTIERLAAECPRVVGIKDSSGDLPQMMRMIAAIRPQRPEFAFLTGWEAALLPMLLIGCNGGTNATAGIVPEIVCRLYDESRAGNLDEALRLQFKVLKFFDAMLYSADFPEGFRAALGLRGFSPGHGRQPLGETQQVDLNVIRHHLQCLMAEEGLSDEPAAGCPAPKAAISDEDVDQIAGHVLAELRRRGMA